MVAAVRCAPPDNKPTPRERDNCAPWLAAELAQLAATLRVIVCLGGFARQALWPPLAPGGWEVPRPRPAFAHGPALGISHATGEFPPFLLLRCHPPAHEEHLPCPGHP